MTEKILVASAVGALGVALYFILHVELGVPFLLVLALNFLVGDRVAAVMDALDKGAKR